MSVTLIETKVIGVVYLTIVYAYQRSNDPAYCSRLIIISQTLEHHTLFAQTMFSHLLSAYKISQEKILEAV